VDILGTEALYYSHLIFSHVSYFRFSIDEEFDSWVLSQRRLVFHALQITDVTGKLPDSYDLELIRNTACTLHGILGIDGYLRCPDDTMIRSLIRRLNMKAEE
jgi:hypothetical protein